MSLAVPTCAPASPLLQNVLGALAAVASLHLDFLPFLLVVGDEELFDLTDDSIRQVGQLPHFGEELARLADRDQTIVALAETILLRLLRFQHADDWIVHELGASALGR